MSSTNPTGTASSGGGAWGKGPPEEIQQQLTQNKMQGEYERNANAQQPQQQQQQQPQQQRPRPPRPVAVAPTSGVPYGHVPAYLPGLSSLVEELDQRVMMVLRDGRHLIGTLCSFDQYSNLVLQKAVERKIHRHKDGKTYIADYPLGIYIVRGESMVMIGRVKTIKEKEKEVDVEPVGVIKLSPNDFEALVEETSKDAEPPLDWNVDQDLLA